MIALFQVVRLLIDLIALTARFPAAAGCGRRDLGSAVLNCGSGSGAPTLGSGGCSTAFAVALSPAAIISFPAPATSNVACGFPRTTLTCLLHASGYETWPLTMRTAGLYGDGSNLVHWHWCPTASEQPDKNREE